MAAGTTGELWGVPASRCRKEQPDAFRKAILDFGVHPFIKIVVEQLDDSKFLHWEMVGDDQTYTLNWFFEVIPGTCHSFRVHHHQLTMSMEDILEANGI